MSGRAVGPQTRPTVVPPTMPWWAEALVPVVLLSAALLSVAACSVGAPAVTASAPASADGTTGQPTGAPRSGDDGREEVAATDPPRPPEVDVVLSALEWDADAGELWAAGWVSPVVEDGGTCAVELTRDGRTHVVRSTGMADATTTVCGEMTIASGVLTSGTWSAVLRYESDTAEGASAPVTIEVPA